MMTLSIDQVLSDAKRLVDRLKDHDSAADHLIQETTTLNKKIEVMKEVINPAEHNKQLGPKLINYFPTYM